VNARLEAVFDAGVPWRIDIRSGARVTLTLHFWSGATVTYYVTRSGDAVTGAVP
jgi:carbohydrate binding protein with CBM46 domain